MKLPITGGCICGDIRYECVAEPMRMVKCHCRDCQQVGGGAYAPVVVVHLKDFKLISGAMQRYSTTRHDGRPNVRGFCPRCGSRLTVGEDAERDIIGVMAASLDEPAAFKPIRDIFVSDAQHWDQMDPEIPKFAEHAPRPPRPSDGVAPS